MRERGRTRAALGKKREIQRGKLNNEFGLVWAGGSIYDVSLETTGAVSGRCAAFPINGVRRGSGFEGGNLQRPGVQSIEALEVGREGKPSTEAWVG